MVGLDYKDTVQLVKVKRSNDGYAMELIDKLISVPGLFLANTGFNHSNWQRNIQSDAEVYLDPENSYIQQNFNRLEGMYIIARPFGEDAAEAWYQITNVVVGQDKLLNNQIDNINCQLKKTTEIPYVS